MQINEVLSYRGSPGSDRASRNRRSRLEIYIELLSNIKSGVNKPTQIMYATNLSWNAFKRVIKKMLANEHVQEIDTTLERAPRSRRDNRTKKIYRLTEKGERVIHELTVERSIARLLLTL